MAKITIDIPDQYVEVVVNALAVAWGYPSVVEDEDEDLVPNPESKAAFVKRYLIQRIIKDTVKRVLVRQLIQPTKDATRQEVDNIDIR